MDNIEEVIRYIHNLQKFHKNADFNNIKIVLNEFDNPQNDYEIIHVTGTNGKGSVTHFINQMLIDSGYKTGMFTSPYIVEFNERIQFNNSFISDKDLIKLTNEIIQVTNRLSQVILVEFEFVTILGFLYFSRKKVDVAVIEVGIGGYHDKTNIINSIISVINNVGLDHQKIIGPTLKDIAYEKSGIIKKNNIVILGEIKDELMTIFEKKVKNENAHIKRLNKDFYINEIESNKFSFIYKKLIIDNIELSSYGEFQIKNAAVAIMAFAAYQEYKSNDINKVIIKSSIKKVKMLARNQIIHENPRIIIDGAHNIDAANELVKNIKTRNVKFLIAMMKDKNFNEVLKIFESVSNDITITTTNESRSLNHKDVINSDLSYPFTDNWEKFIDIFMEKKSKKTLIVTGSLHFVSQVLNYFA